MKTQYNPQALRADIIETIMLMRQWDEEYARLALAHYSNALPWLLLNRGVTEAMQSSASASTASSTPNASITPP